MSDIESDAPVATDDDGTGRSGTPIDETWYDALLAAINVQTLSATNPTLTPADTIDEVVTARNAYASLDARLDALATDLGISSLATVTQLLGGVGAVNLITNDDCQIWVAGDTAAPTGDVLAGTGAAVARCGTGLADTTRKIGDFCARLTRGTTDASLSQTLLSGASFIRAGFLPSLYAAAGCWVKCSTANAARIAVYDGVGYSYSSYHTGGGAWEWLAVTRQINVAADQLVMLEKVDNAAVAAYFSGRTLLILDGDLDLTRYVPAPSVQGTFHFGFSGTIAVATAAGRAIPSRPAIVRDVQLDIKTAPTGAALIVDVLTETGSGAGSMFSTKPQIAATAYSGAAQPDGTYARRCVAGGFGATLAAGQRLTVDVSQVGSSVAGADLAVEVRMLQYQSPLERFWSYSGS